MDGLLSMSSVLANVANLVSESLEVNKTSGEVSGKLEVSEGLTGTFSKNVNAYKIELSVWDSRAQLRRTLSLGFSEDNGVARSAKITVRSLPDNNKAANAESIGGKQFIGWRANIDPVEGAMLYRTTSRIEDPGPLSKYYLTEISDDREIKPRDMPGMANTNTFDLWLRRLRYIENR